jgi:hypothetical protein
MPLYLVRLLSFEQFCPPLSFRLLAGFWPTFGRLPADFWPDSGWIPVGFWRVRALNDIATAGILAQCDETPQQNDPVKPHLGH